MAKKNKSVTDFDPANYQPDELNALKNTVIEFVKKIENIDSEIETLKEDRKGVIEDYSEKLDVKTLNSVLRVLKIEANVKYKNTFDVMREALTDAGLN